MATTPASTLARLTAQSIRGWLGLGLGLACAGALVALDVHWGPGAVITATVVAGPFVAAMLSPPRLVAVVSALAVAAAAVSPAWNDNFGTDAYWLRLAVVALASAFAVLAAQAIAAVAESRRRFALLGGLAEAGDGTRTLEETIEAVSSLIVPAFADIGILDLVQQGRTRRLGVRAHGSRAAEIEAWLRARPPQDPEVPIASRRAAETASAQLVERLTPDMLRSMAHDEADAEMILSLGSRSSITVPLRARGLTLGALSLTVTDLSKRRYGPLDARFAKLMAGRVALALDNAGLSAELMTTEAQLSAALGSLSDAVTVQTPEGRLVYANDVAAASMGFASAEELLAAAPHDIVDRYDAFTEDGAPLRVEDLPGRRVLAGEDAEPLVVRAVHRDTGRERWSVVKASAVRDSDGRPVLAVNVVEDITDVKRAELAQRLLARAGEVLASSLDYELTLQQVAELAVPELADWCAVSLPDAHGLLRQVAVAHVDPAKARFGRKLSQRYPARVDEPTGAAQVLREGVSQVYNGIPDELLRARARGPEHYELLRGLGMRAVMIVPLMGGGGPIGTLALVSAESGRFFSDADVELAEELARRAGTAVENARLYTERSNIAATLQAGLLPRDLPQMPGWPVATMYRPAGSENWVGGDFYDAFPIRDGWMIVVGDVVGRGAPAAALTALARHTIRAVAQLLDTPLDAIDRLNAELLDRGASALCTVGCAVLREVDGAPEATILCAGHPQPFLLRDGEAKQVGEFGPMIGAFADATWSPVRVPLRDGDTLVFYTDGVIDTVGAESRFGEQRLAETLAGVDGPAEAVARIRTALLEFERGDQADDTAILAVGRMGVEAAEDRAGNPSASGERRR